MIYSFSRLDLFGRCPYRWYQKYAMGREEPVTKPLALGKAVHKAVELRTQGILEDEAVVAGIIETDFHPEVTTDDIKELLQNAPRMNGETEVHFELPLSSSASAPRIQGYIDLIQPNRFVDWKTNWQMYGANDTMQLRLYAWALMEMRGWDQVEGMLYFLRYRRRVPYVYSRSDADRARAWALKVADEIERKMFTVELFPEMTEDIFHPSPGAYCKHCPYAAECVQKFLMIYS